VPRIFLGIVHTIKNGENNKKRTLRQEKQFKKLRKVVGINKTAQNRFRESFHLIFCCFTVAFISFFIHGQEDQSAVSELTNRSETVQNGWVNLVLFCLI
jgi:hypothetical protein